ncbi:MAG TPA: ATPase domain-containing protein, partial [Rhodopila sp.]
GSSLLLSGVAGSGKTLIGCHFVNAACQRGERCLFFAYEESAAEMCRNAASVGLDLQRWVDAGLLRFEATRPALYGLEMHLARMHRDVEAFAPSVVVVDPISAFRGPEAEVHAALLRMVDLLKSKGISSLFTSLRSGDSIGAGSGTDHGLSSLMDTWIKLSDVEGNGERNRLLCIIKSRGMSHSNQVREYLMTDTGIQLTEAYVGSEGILTGTARMLQEARDQAARELHVQRIERRRRDIARRQAALQRRIADLQARLAFEEAEGRTLLLEEEQYGASPVGPPEAPRARRSALE